MLRSQPRRLSALDNPAGRDPAKLCEHYHRVQQLVPQTGTFYFAGNSNFLFWPDRKSIKFIRELLIIRSECPNGGEPAGPQRGQSHLLHLRWKPALAGAGHGLQIRCAAHCRGWVRLPLASAKSARGYNNSVVGDSIPTGAAPDPNAETIELIEEAYPLETEVLGKRTVARIVSGVDYRPTGSGRHINLMDTVALISCAASVIQVVLTLWNPLAPKPAAEPTLEQVKERLAGHDEALRMLTQKPEILITVVGAMKQRQTRHQRHS
jgi:hypothetical protein